MQLIRKCLCRIELHTVKSLFSIRKETGTMGDLFRNKKMILVGLPVIAVLIIAAVMLGTMLTNDKVQAAAPQPDLMPASSINAGPFTCNISNIAVFSGRIQSVVVGSSTVSYFAANGDSAHALTTNRFLTLLNTAYALGKPVYIYYLTNTADNPPGCNSGDCRAIDWLFIVP